MQVYVCARTGTDAAGKASEEVFDGSALQRLGQLEPVCVRAGACVRGQLHTRTSAHTGPRVRIESGRPILHGEKSSRQTRPTPRGRGGFGVKRNEKVLQIRLRPARGEIRASTCAKEAKELAATRKSRSNYLRAADALCFSDLVLLAS